MNKFDVVKKILENCSLKSVCEKSSAFASTNVALCKYWGKRDEELNLPMTSSLSLTLDDKGAFTTVSERKEHDLYIVNGEEKSPNSSFTVRLRNFLDLFRRDKTQFFQVDSYLNIPIASGLASSACGFAALVEALNGLYDWQLKKEKLSILARLGSGSACRSLWPGFVEWQAGSDLSGMDSFGVPLLHEWSELRVGLLLLSSQEKLISSRDAMRYTKNSSPLYNLWPEQVTSALKDLKIAIEQKDFELFGRTAEANALSMHEMMLNADPSLDYSLPETYDARNKIYEMRDLGAPVFFTQDAGANLQLLFLEENSFLIRDFFPNLEIISPFLSSDIEQVILVNENDTPIGISEKIKAHLSGKLHRAFSVFILRQKAGVIEVLLQKRQNDKYHSGGLWSNSCCGHPRVGEDIIDAAQRRLQEEMGFSADLEILGKFIYRAKVASDLTEYELDYVLMGLADRDDPIFNRKEVEDIRWLSLNLLQQDLTLSPQKYTSWLSQALKVLVNK